MERRGFVIFLCAAGSGLQGFARAQNNRVRRIGMFLAGSAQDPEMQLRVKVFVQTLNELGWIEGRNLRIEYRFGNAEIDRYPKYAAELLAWEPDVLVASASNVTRALQKATHSVPIVFATATDPVGGGLVASLARPGANVTGLSQRDFSLTAKSLELLKQVVPTVAHVAVLRDPTTAGGGGQLGAIQAVAPSLGVDVTPVDVHDPAEIESSLAAFARHPHAGLVVTTSALGISHRSLIVKLAAQYHLPAAYPVALFVTAGGLLSYGPDQVQAYRETARYVDRILKGEKPANMPVQQPTKFEFVLNLKTARALAITVPHSILQRADRVIE